MQYDDELSEMENVANGLFAIARALHRLGNADASTPMGGLEALGAAQKEGAERIASALDGVSSAIQEHTRYGG